ncbi:scavenger receptor class F member 2-like isoform X1 [Saccostrea cucullata]|uniref:scavenger receptor class F member 2-like isoform X1 n=1 Tax=Saccostrea cuccullata TaxID=36930 RepID=UPI002ED04072
MACGYCKRSEECNQINGTCLNGCSRGYKGKYCNTTCHDGYFGENCVYKCNDTCKECNRMNGSCGNICHPGFKGEFCHEVCDLNWYGEGCNKSCGECTVDSGSCHHINGSCVNGCDAGYHGNKCDKICEFGFYGPNCKSACSPFCKVSRDCHHVTGTCNYGCKAGVQGNDCLLVQDSENVSQIKFYGILSTLCATLLIIGIYALYKIKKRMILSRTSTGTSYSVDDSVIPQTDSVALIKKDDQPIELNHNNQNTSKLDISTNYDTKL